MNAGDHTVNDETRAARYKDLFGGRHEHPPNCAYCPICAAIGVVRNTKPEVLDHLANAARELITVFGLLLEEAERSLATAEGARPGGHGSGAKVRRIDVG